MTFSTTSADVLKLIRSGEAVTGAEIRAALGIGRSELGAAVKELSKDGLVGKERRKGAMVYWPTKPKRVKPNGWGIPTF